jgi:hypothetical protein
MNGPDISKSCKHLQLSSGELGEMDLFKEAKMLRYKRTVQA